MGLINFFNQLVGPTTSITTIQQTLYPEDITTLEEEELDATYANYIAAVEIQPYEYVVANYYFSGASDHGVVRVVTTNRDNTNIVVEDTLEHTDYAAYYQSIERIDDMHFMLAYVGGADGDDLTVKTFSVHPVTWAITEIDSLLIASVGGYPSLKQVSATHYLLCYEDSLSDGYAQTIEIDDDYLLTAKDNLGFNNDHISGHIMNDLIEIADHLFMLNYYKTTGKRNYFAIFEIDSAANITERYNQMTTDNYSGNLGALGQLDDTHFIWAAMRNVTWDGIMKTFVLDKSAWTLTELDYFVYDDTGSATNQIQYQMLITISPTLFAISDARGSASGNDRYLSTFNVSTDGLCTVTALGTLMYHTLSGKYSWNSSPSLLRIGDNNCIAFYSYDNTAWKGAIETFSLSTLEIVETKKLLGNLMPDILKGASLLTYIYHGIKHRAILEFQTFANSSVLWWKKDYQRILGPLPLTIPSFLMDEDFNAYDMTTTSEGYFGGIIFGPLDWIPLPTVDFTDNESVLNDLIASSFMAMTQEKMDIAYAFLQSAHKLMSLYEISAGETEDHKQLIREHGVRPYEL